MSHPNSRVPTGPDDGEPADTDAGAATRKRNLIATAGIGGLLVVVAGTLAAMGLSGGASTTAPSATPVATSVPVASAPPASGDGAAATGDDAASTDDPVAPGDDAEVDPDFGAPVADRVPGGGVADFGDEVTARLTAITPMTATASLPGEVAGPAVRVTLELTNTSSDALDLDTVVVNAYYGADATPASPVASDESADQMSGSLKKGDTAKGSYVFSVPEGEADDLVVTVGKGDDPALVVFGG
jgi:hypothetical protein